MQAPQPSSSRH